MGEDGGVAAVERALSILDALTEDRVTLVELSVRTGLYKSTVLRLLKSLEKYGYVLRNEEGLYRLGSKVLQLGALYQRHFRTSDVVLPVLEKLAAEVHEGASFYVGEDDRRICLHRVDSTRAIRDAVHVGDRLPLTVGAAGHVLRAFGGARGARFDQIRRAMYASSFGERDAETAAIAAPVFGGGNQLLGVLSVSGPRYRLEGAGEAQIVPVLFKYAKELTRTCGGDADEPSLSGWNLPEPARKGGAAKAKAVKTVVKAAVKAAVKTAVKAAAKTSAPAKTSIKASARSAAKAL